MPRLQQFRPRLTAYAPQLLPTTGRHQAAVAVILRPGEDDGDEVLLIERARREGDPWSGQMAFPGGRLDPGDRDARAAAERETLEEVGLPLAEAEYLGRIDDLIGNPRVSPDLVISAHVYHQPDPRELALEEAEVSSALWFPLGRMLDADSHVDYAHPHLPERVFPGIRVGEDPAHVVWGLTYRFLDIFFGVIGHPLSDRWQDLRDEDLR